MLILLITVVKTLTQKFYSDLVNKYDSLIRGAVCPCCGKSLGMIMHGSYPRKFRSTDNPVQIRIQRFRCKHCGATHAVFLSAMIPFFRITTPDACSFLNASDRSSREQFAVKLSIDDDSIRYLSNRYRHDWQDKISVPIRHSCAELAVECVSSFRMWFLQKSDMKRKLSVSFLPTYPSCNPPPFPLTI